MHTRLSHLMRLAYATLALLFFYSASAHANPPYIDAAVGSAHVCGLSSDGSLVCETTEFSTRLNPPADLPALSAIDLGAQHGCGITVEGAVVCWGDNDLGQLDVPAFDNPVVKLDTHYYTTCAIDTLGAVTCWGSNDNGRATPPNPAGPYIDVTVGLQHACALRSDGTSSCWGAPGRTITGSDGVERYPGLEQPAGSAYVDIEAAQYFNSGNTCGLTAGGDVSCWGLHHECTFSGGVTTCTAEPPPSLTGLSLTSFGHVEDGICGIDISGEIHCAYVNDGPPATLDIPTGLGYKRITSHFNNTCFIDAGDDVQCIDRNNRWLS